MSTLNVTTIQTANGTTDLTLTTGNTSGPSIVVGANGSFTYSNVNSFSVGANVAVTTSALSIGNSTVNTVANSTTVTTSSLSIGNSTVNTVANSTTMSIGSNVVVSTSSLRVGNSTVNTVVNSSSVALTGNLIIGTATAQTPTGNAPLSFCRAWVNFNGTGTVAIRASYNVTSITDNGTGDFTVNFTTAMPDADYSAIGSATSDGSAVTVTYENGTYAQYRTSSAYRFIVYAIGVNVADRQGTYVAIFR